MLYDAIIIGAGTMGMSAGYYLAKEGRNVALIDAHHPPHSEGSHHGETRIIRHAYGEGENYVPMALRASELWAKLERKSHRKIFHNTGVLNIGTKDSAFIHNVIESANMYSLPVEVLNAREINARWGGFNLSEDLIGCYETTSGVLMSEEAIRAYRELAVSHGATLYTNTKIENIDVDAGKVEVRFENNRVIGKQLIITSGKGTNKILSLLNEKLPLTPVRKTFSWFDCDEEIYHSGVFPAWSFDDGKRTFYGFPSIHNAGIKIGRHDGGIEVNPDKALKEFGAYPEDEHDVTEFLNNHFSSKLVHRQGKVCTYTNTPDGDFIIDRLSKYENVLVACGFSGHGFKFGSVVGEILSQLVMQGKSELDISNFSIERF